MEEQLLKEILESYEILMSKSNYYCDRGKGTKKYTLDRISDYLRCNTKSKTDRRKYE